MPAIENTKRCSHCGEPKAASEFHANRAARDGLCNQCKECTLSRQRKFRLENPERQRETGRRSYWNNREKNKEYKAEYNRSNKESRKEYSRKYDDANREKRRAHWRVKDALSRGDLVRPDACTDCGNHGSVQGHHDDYSKPLDVEWLCPACHRMRHRKWVVEGGVSLGF